MELSKKKKKEWLRESVWMDNSISGILKINIRKLLSKKSLEKLSPDFP